MKMKEISQESNIHKSKAIDFPKFVTLKINFSDIKLCIFIQI